MWQDYLHALLTAIGLSALSCGIGLAVLRIGERKLERRFDSVGIRDLIARRARCEQALEARRLARLEEIKALDAEVRDSVRRRHRLERQVNDSRAAANRTIRLIGEEVEGTPCFVATVVNRLVGSSTFQQKPHAYIDRSWSEPQTVEVWTRTVQDARSEIERRYPPAFGYMVVRLGELGGAGDPRQPASPPGR